MSSQSVQISVVETLPFSKFHWENLNFNSLGMISNDFDH